MWPSVARARRALWGGADPRPGVSGSQPPGYEGLRAEGPLPARQAVLEALPQQKEGVCLRPASSSALRFSSEQVALHALRTGGLSQGLGRPPDGAGSRPREGGGHRGPLLQSFLTPCTERQTHGRSRSLRRSPSWVRGELAGSGPRCAPRPLSSRACVFPWQPSARDPLSRRRSRGRRRVKTHVRVTETAGESWAASAWAAHPLPSSLIHLLPPLLLTRGPQRESASPPGPWCLCPDGKLGGVSTHSRVVSRTPGPSAARPGGAAAGTTRCWREGRRGLRGVAGRARRGPAGRGRWEVSESTGFFLSYGARKSWAESRNFFCLHFWEIRAQPASRFLRAEGWIENSAPREGSACKPRRGEGVCLRPGLLHRRLCPWS